MLTLICLLAVMVTAMFALLKKALFYYRMKTCLLTSEGRQVYTSSSLRAGRRLRRQIRQVRKEAAATVVPGVRLLEDASGIPFASFAFCTL